MSALSRVLRSVEGNRLMFWCPGCEGAHVIDYSPGRWTWDGNVERPTFSPSVLVRGRNFTEAGREQHRAWVQAGCQAPAPEFESAEVVCHSFVRDGQIEFLGDCTHAMKGQTVPLGAVDHEAWE